MQTRFHFAALTSFAVAAATIVTTAQAQDQTVHALGQHPAMLVKARTQSIDPNTFIVGHPASPQWVRGHANHEHPAVQVAHRAEHPQIDTNTFLVQPPATTAWTMGPEVDTQLAGAPAAPSAR